MLKKTILMVLILVLLAQAVLAITATGLNGEDIEITQEFCQDEVNGFEVLGSDFYLFCEENLEEAYYDVPEIDIQEDVVEESIFDDYQINESEPEIVGESDWTLFLAIGGIVFLLMILILIISHKIMKKRDLNNQLRQMAPYINTLRQRGYSEAQIEEMLIKKGYDHQFINEVVRR